MGGKDIEGEIGEHSSWERDPKASRQQDSCGLVYQGADSRGEELKPGMEVASKSDLFLGVNELSWDGHVADALAKSLWTHLRESAPH